MIDESNTGQAEGLEQEARSLGWVPQADFKGKPDNWVDAETFVEKGKHVLPIMRENNQRIRQELNRTTGELTKVQEQLKASQESISALEEHHQEMLKQKLEQQRKTLLEDLREAKRGGDVDEEIRLTEELTQLPREPAKEKKPNGGDGKPVEFKPPQEFLDWQAENSWFGQDMRRTALAHAIGQELRTKGDKRVGRPFLDAVAEEVAGMFGEGDRASNKVEGGRGGGGRQLGGRKSYADLPSDAKQACDGFAKKLVGEGRAFKTIDDWRKKYAADYFEGE